MRTLAFFILLFAAAATGYAAEISGVPFVKQETLQCGPAALSSVFQFYGVPMDQQVISKAVYSDKLQGTLISDLENFARAKGFQTILGQGTAGQLKQFVDEGKPVIVPVDMGIWLISKPHYLLVFGYGKRASSPTAVTMPLNRILIPNFNDYGTKQAEPFSSSFHDRPHGRPVHRGVRLHDAAHHRP